MSDATVNNTVTHTADTPQVLLEHHLKELRLPTILREYNKVARQCAVEQVDYARYLLRMTELELLDRKRRATDEELALLPGGIDLDKTRQRRWYRRVSSEEPGTTRNGL